MSGAAGASAGDGSGAGVSAGDGVAGAAGASAGAGVSAGDGVGTMRVRLFAAAAEAVGAQELELASPPTAGALREALGALGDEAPVVIARCALLRAGERLEDGVALAPGDLVDVLPPFAGG
ncbi:MoaD/ThiS family protein [Demequina rhizosphaerae]|uniref:MoaD/ThiS family protein n=1 Tax=Demequina rhizosphaerae TaxID=1638985 RepID=UPI000A931B11|nr:MoaD/ThiS family protein [Demequina rhizosphaerae]